MKEKIELLDNAINELTNLRVSLLHNDFLEKKAYNIEANLCKLHDLLSTPQPESKEPVICTNRRKRLWCDTYLTDDKCPSDCPLIKQQPEVKDINSIYELMLYAFQDKALAEFYTIAVNSLITIETNGEEIQVGMTVMYTGRHNANWVTKNSPYKVKKIEHDYRLKDIAIAIKDDVNRLRWYSANSFVIMNKQSNNGTQ